MERGRQYRVVAQVLTVLAGLLAVAGIAVSVLVGSGAAGFPLALGTLLVGGAVYAVGNATVHYDRERESPEGARRRRRVSIAVTTALAVLLLAILLVEVVAVLTGLGYFSFFGTFPSLVIRFYAIPVGVLLAAFAGAVAVRTHLPGDGAPSRRARMLGYGALVLTVLLVVVSLSVSGGVAQSLGLIDSPADRAPFALALAFFPLWTWLRIQARYPAPRAAATWMGEALRVEERNLGQGMVVAGGMASVAAGVLAAFLHYVVGDVTMALTATAAGALLLLLVPVGVGFARVVEEIEETREGYEAERRRRRAVLMGFTALHTILAAAVLAVAVLAPVLGLTGVLLAHFPVVFLAVVLAGGTGALGRTQVRAEDEYTHWRKVLSSQLIAVVTVLAFLGVFLAVELAQGPIVGAANAVLVLSVAWALALLHVKNRLLLPSLAEQVVVRYREREERVREDLDADEQVERSMWAAYLAAMGLVLAGVAAMGLMLAGVAPTPSGQASQVGLGGVWILVVTVVAGVGLYRQIQRRNIETVDTGDEDEAVIGERRFKRHELLRYSILGFSVATALALFVVGGLVMGGVITSLAGRPIAQKFSTDFFVFGLLVGLGPFGYFHAREQKRIRKMDQRLPEFLRDLAESKRAGMTLTESIITASRGTYGELTPEIRKMAAQLEWGVSFNDALMRFSDRVDTPLVERTVNLIVEASSAGGNVVDVLGAAADDAREIQQILQERRDSMVIYVMIIYVAFLVFLGVIGVLNAQFIPEISRAVSEASRSGAPSIGGLQFTEVDTQAYKTLFFHAAVIQGLGGGLVAGVMRGGKPVEGLKHSFAMIAIAYVTFRLVLGA